MQNRTGQFNANALIAEVKRRTLLAELEARYCSKTQDHQKPYGAKSSRTIDTSDCDAADHDDLPIGYQDAFGKPKVKAHYPKSRKPFAHDPFTDEDEETPRRTPQIHPTAQDFCALATFAVTKGLIATDQVQAVARELGRAYRASPSWELSRDPAPRTLRYGPTNYNKNQLLIAAHLLEAACAGTHYLDGTTSDTGSEPSTIKRSIAHGLLPNIIALLAK
jgi:hypothetical protein